MVEIAPFHAIRYTAKDLSPLLAPPYDVIDDAEQQRLYDRHQHNIVRIDFNKPETSDHRLARYERAAGFLDRWLSEGVLARDSKPGLYVLAQTFTGPDGVERTRTGFFSRVRLVRFDEGQVLPHERTLKGPKVDRLELFRATRTNLSPIFGAYQDPDRAVEHELSRWTAEMPIADATMGGVRNRLWHVEEASNVVRAFASKKLYIADGHHRYETGLAYRDERREQNGGKIDPDAGYEHILMFSAAVEDPGMVIFPTHRLVHGLSGLDEAAVHEKLSRYFSVEDAPADVREAQRALTAAGDGANAYLMITQRSKKILRSRKDAPWYEVRALPEHRALRTLDVSVLHAVVMEQVLGISREAQEAQTNLKYSKDFTQAFGSVGDPSVQAAFLMNPTKIEEVIAVAESGEVMPQKSTFFYPKIPSGLVLYPLDN